MTRKQAINLMRVAAYHDDRKAWMRLYIENRVSKETANDAWRKGVLAKQTGMKCMCTECKR